MTQNSPDPLLRLVDSVQVVRDSVGFPEPLVAHGAIYAGEQEHELVKFSWKNLAPEWRVPADGFDFVGVFGDLVLLDSFDTGHSRGMHPDGTIAWTLEPKGTGWALWRDHLYAVGPDIGMVLADPLTGQILGPNALVIRSTELLVSICEDVVLLQDDAGDPFRAFHLLRNQVLWEANLLATLRQRFDARDDCRYPYCKSSGPGLFVCKYGKGLYGFDLDTGRLLWGLDVVVRAINTHQSRIYIWGCTADTRVDRLICLDPATGNTIFEAPREAQFVRAAGAISERHITHSTRSGFICASRIADGALVWAHQHQERLASVPVVFGGRLLISTEDGNLLVFEGTI